MKPTHGGDVRGDLIVFNDNGGWSWFQDERAIVDGERILVASIANGSGAGGPARSGHVEVAVLDLVTRGSSVHHLGKLSGDDHGCAALLTRPDGRYLAVYSDHHKDDVTRYRISERPGDPSSWRPERTFANGARTTYSNVVHLSEPDRTYVFTRSRGFDPNYLVSSDQGDSWSQGGCLMRDPAGDGGARPYVKYASNHRDRVYFVGTEGHPSRVNSSVYAGYFAADGIHRMNGSLVGPTRATPRTAPSVTDLTLVFRAEPEGIVGSRTHAWPTDIALDAEGNPFVVFTTRVQTGTHPPTAGTSDHRFHVARWIGTTWMVHEVAKAGGGLYPGEDDYTGLAALVTGDPNVIYVSTPVDPSTDAPLAHHEIYRGTVTDDGTSWGWEPVTAGSTVDNLRPVVPEPGTRSAAVLWLRGTYRSFKDYDLSVVGIVS